MTPTGLIEGIADYTALKAKYYKPEFFARPGSGKRWDQGYSITARFLEYCDGLKPGFVAAMNRKMRDTWSLNYFVELVGKPVDQLWREYKAKYAGVGNFTEDTNLGLWGEHKDMHYYDAKEETGNSQGEKNSYVESVDVFCFHTEKIEVDQLEVSLQFQERFFYSVFGNV
ncbi:hypothetical protein ACSBR1_019739 [Camellia fascicularis]